MFQKLGQEIITVTPMMAQDYMKMAAHPAQRPIQDRHVQFLAGKMKSGEFRTGELAVAYNGEGASYIMNGNHQLRAIIKSGKPVQVLLEKFFCEDKQEMAHLFRQFDNHRMRSINDMLRVEADSRNINWPARICSLIASAAATIESGSTDKVSTGMKRDRKCALLSRYLKEGDFISSILGGHKRVRTKFMWRVAVFCAMIMTFRKSPVSASVFWEGVRDGENLKKKAPQLTLRDFLMSSSMKTTQNHKTTTYIEILVRCIHAWNAFRAGKTTILRYYYGKPVPKVQ